MNKIGADEEVEKLLGIFNSIRSTDEMVANNINKKPFIFDDKYIDSTIAKTFQISPFKPSEDLIKRLKLRIVSTYDIYQEEGDALLGEYNHVDWYPEQTSSRFYWDRYKDFLLQKKPYMKATMGTFDKNTDRITNYFGDPKSELPFQIRGLVMGDVQSGKTSTYIGTICKAVDAGYKVIVLLTGMVESLRKQTQKRVDEGFVGYDSVKNIQVGVGIGTKTLYPRTLTSSASDYTGSNVDKNTNMAIQIEDKIPLILVCKKNTKVLEKIIKGMRSLNTSSSHKKIDAPLLLIDDEADNASINTNTPDLDPTAINSDIRILLELFKKATYVGFTATPFANVFIQPNNIKEMLGNNLFPNDFIYSLKAPTDYVGPSDLFIPGGKDYKCLVEIADSASNSDLFSYSHKKDWSGDKLFPSFYESIITFCLANAIRDIRGDTFSHRSMLINMSRFKDVQFKIRDITEDYLTTIKKSVRLFGMQIDAISLVNPIMKSIYEVWKKQYEGKIGISWQQIKTSLYSSIENIDVVVVNSASKAKLDYDEHQSMGWRVIAVGGLALSRGLTLEGLVVSYFYRNTSTYDVLMQMGRWFGYRTKYEDIVRVWITKTSATWYGEIAGAIENLRQDIKRMCYLKITPKDFGIRVRNDSDDLCITASNKMRNAIDKIDRQNESFYGNIFETTLISPSIDDTSKNWQSVEKLAKKLTNRDDKIRQPYFRNITKQIISEFLKSLALPDVGGQFDQNQICRFVETNNDKHLDHWDVLFVSKDESELGDAAEISLPNDIKIKPNNRTCSMTNGGYISVSGGSAHIGSRDTKTGLSASQIKEAENARVDFTKNASQKIYMIKGRNPLLIIYFLNPALKNYESTFSEALTILSSLKNGIIPVFSVGFPQNDDPNLKESVLYKTNADANYYKKAGFLTEESKEVDEI